MKIKCHNCQREMSVAEFMTYPGAYLLKLLEKPLADFFVRTVEHYLLTPKKGVVEDCMSGLANNYFKIECPQCKEIGSWMPAPDDINLPDEKQDKQLHV